WCTADDVWQRAPRAADLAGGERGFAALTEAVLAAAGDVAPVVPGLGELAIAHEPAGAELDLDTAGQFIELAPAVLEGLGIDLLGPEPLVRAKLAVRGTARTAPSDGRPGRLGRDALVDWQALVDDVPMSAADLARVEAAGSTLMRAGHRWVRIDPAGV